MLKNRLVIIGINHFHRHPKGIKYNQVFAKTMFTSTYLTCKMCLICYSAYDPADYENLPVTPEIKELFQYITR